MGTFQEFMGTGISEGGTFMGSVQKDFYGKDKEELHENSARGTFMKSEEEHSWEQCGRNIMGTV